ncbi:hypothetical protein [Sphingosinicella sp. BN140058]|uniref:hypothetical protein n=1 Tax=Sphingosinicella sp. BN140058 TaxID=1892855 RepID=UPI0010104201|nr:hypothetical protein [Sphingosinicella sp. BN140058]QAY75827.1 hypothetical protein ETR14_04235 [Sphingosinicella sp. BN140058]
MIKAVILSSAGFLLTSAAVAQDYTGNVDPSAYSLPNVMHSAINAQAKGAKSPRYTISAQSREGCRNLPSIRARLGARDARVQKITRLCRELGLIR